MKLIRQMKKYTKNQNWLLNIISSSIINLLIIYYEVNFFNEFIVWHLL